MPVWAVASGRQTGVFATWGACEKSVKGFSRAVHKRFAGHAEAAAWLEATLAQSIPRGGLQDPQLAKPSEQGAAASEEALTSEQRARMQAMRALALERLEAKRAAPSQEAVELSSPPALPTPALGPAVSGLEEGEIALPGVMQQGGAASLPPSAALAPDGFEVTSGDCGVSSLPLEPSVRAEPESSAHEAPQASASAPAGAPSTRPAWLATHSRSEAGKAKQRKRKAEARKRKKDAAKAARGATPADAAATAPTEPPSASQVRAMAKQLAQERKRLEREKRLAFSRGARSERRKLEEARKAKAGRRDRVKALRGVAGAARRHRNKGKMAARHDPSKRAREHDPAPQRIVRRRA